MFANLLMIQGDEPHKRLHEQALCEARRPESP